MRERYPTWDDIETRASHLDSYLASGIQAARAKDAELLADAEMRRLNDVSNAADTERRRWYAAIGGDLTGLSPEVVASRLREDRATAERTILALYAELAAKDAEIARLTQALADADLTHQDDARVLNLQHEELESLRAQLRAVLPS